MKVLKFGGTSVGSVNSILSVKKIRSMIWNGVTEILPPPHSIQRIWIAINGRKQSKPPD